MQKKFQENDPNNARITVDYNNPKSPVKFEYVGTQSPYKICYNWAFRRIYLYFFPFLFLELGYLYFLMKISMGTPMKAIWICYVAIGSTFFFFYGFPALFALLFSKTRLIKLMPKLSMGGETKYVAEFQPKDVIDNKIELPLYDNVFLGYKAEADFSSCLDRVEIREHPFNILTFKQKLFRKGERELKPNEYLWKATFYFSRQPTSGSLKLIFTA